MTMTHELEQIMNRRRRKENDLSTSFVSPLIAPARRSTQSTRSSSKSNIQNDTTIGSANEEEERSVTKNALNLNDDNMNSNANSINNATFDIRLSSQEKYPVSALTQSAHEDLKGRDRLINLVQCLNQSCPWTLSITSREMLQWLRSELDEIENEMNVIDYISEKEILIHTLKGKEIESDGEKDEGGHQKEIEEIAKKKHVLIQSLTSEMGDILFDTLMLDMIVKREYDLDEYISWDVASEKFERRTPYMKEWGNGSVATTPEEATVLWKIAKSEEKKNDASNVSIYKSVHEQYATEQMKTTARMRNEDESNGRHELEQFEIVQNSKIIQTNNHEETETKKVNQISPINRTIPILTQSFSRLTKILGFNRKYYDGLHGSTTLGFVAGALAMSLLHKIRPK